MRKEAAILDEGGDDVDEKAAIEKPVVPDPETAAEVAAHEGARKDDEAEVADDAGTRTDDEKVEPEETQDEDGNE